MIAPRVIECDDYGFTSDGTMWIYRRPARHVLRFASETELLDRDLETTTERVVRLERPLEAREPVVLGSCDPRPLHAGEIEA